jgi:hypothetical protein
MPFEMPFDAATVIEDATSIAKLTAFAGPSIAVEAKTSTKEPTDLTD